MITGRYCQTALVKCVCVCVRERERYDCIFIHLSNNEYSALLLSDIEHDENVCPLLLKL
jgi:hypothetical protein